MLQPQGRRWGGGQQGQGHAVLQGYVSRDGGLHKDRDTEHTHEYDNPPMPVKEGAGQGAVVTVSRGCVSLDSEWAQSSGCQCVTEAWIAVGSSNCVECGCVSQPVCLTVTGEGEGVPCSLAPIGRTSWSG